MTSTSHDRVTRFLNSPISRRQSLRGLGVAGLATGLGVVHSGRTGAQRTVDSSAIPQIEPGAGTWKTWILSSGDQFRLPRPDAAATATELAELETLANQRDDSALAQISYWDTGAPAYRWNNLAVQHLLANGIGGPRAVRALTLLNVAIADATVAAWDSKYAHNRPRPAMAQPTLTTAIPTPNSPAYPSEHAVTAGAAAAILGFLFPDDAATFDGLAEEAGHSRILAGTDYPSDVAAGMTLGQQVAELVIDWARVDGSDAVWTGSVPTEPGKWTGEKPAEPLAGTWITWAITSGDQFRPEPPPAPESEQMSIELAELKDFERTNLTNLIASYWEYYGGRAFFELYTDQLSQKLFEYRLDLNPPRAARAYALMGIALYDVFVACWDAKYAFWAIRPFMLDDSVTTVFVTPNHPSYPAAHASVGGAMETVLGALFPQDTDHFARMAEDESWSRLWAGIHFTSDIEAGRTLGRQVGQAVVDRASADGAD